MAREQKDRQPVNPGELGPLWMLLEKMGGGHSKRLGGLQDSPELRALSSKDRPEHLPRTPWLPLLTLLCLGLCVVLGVTTVVQVFRIHCSHQERHRPWRACKLGTLLLIPQDLIQSGLEQIHQQLSHINTSLAVLCRPCPWVWEPFQGSCYLFLHTLGSWEASVSSCQDLGAHLVVVNSIAEQRFLRYWDIRKNKHTWIGLSDLRSEGSWHWRRGWVIWGFIRSAMVFPSFWKEGEPNNNEDEDCVELFMDE
ncbi:PREDICTED: CD209 antigen-like protein E [Dipodomys ordii]|uniref:CD209 antigen-like protein E n=1 Tax=Dipodomys ordii TaxID=10020 RepID=A0A1S3GLU0_DIPOR|nr:PREDICTED: CD209 antigen-like protein E [Dipodomys ordii]